jgi:iron complex outermembrane receptor protein
VGNFDLSRPLGERFFIGLGSEFRSENYEVIAGDTASYSGEGANSFPGFQERNAIKANRFNVGAYLDLTWDITDNFLIGGTVRGERYSDFGSTVVYKFSSRYKIADVLVLRGSASTGFRAPSLHQQYLSLTQASFEDGDIVITRLANNFSREARLLGVPRLKAEKSDNYTFGLGLNPDPNFSLTIDYYSIKIKDRIIYSNEVSATTAGGEVENVSFFINAAETKTSGLDLVASYRTNAGESRLTFNVAGNYTLENELVGGWEGVESTPVLIAANQEIFNQTQESLMTTSRPEYKVIVGADWAGNRLAINLNNSVFGPTKFNNGDLSRDLTLEFKTKVLTDLGASFKITQNLTATVTVQNIFNIFPEYKFTANNSDGESILADPAQVAEQVSYITFNGRYPVVTYDGSHFSQMGASFLAQLNYKF